MTEAYRNLKIWDNPPGERIFRHTGLRSVELLSEFDRLRLRKCWPNGWGGRIDRTFRAVQNSLDRKQETVFKTSVDLRARSSAG